MERYFKVNSEFVACVLEITSELDRIMEDGLVPESMSTLERINHRLETLVGEVRSV